MFDKRKFSIWFSSITIAILLLVFVKLWKDEDDQPNGSSNPSAVENFNAEPAIVTKVIDGDTIICLLDGEAVRIRLYGIDAPERKQAFGSQATKFVTRISLGKNVFVEILNKDRYGRTVARIWHEDGSLLNEKILRAGFAWWYKKYAPNDQKLWAAEVFARKEKIGLWAEPSPIAPWAYRQ